MSDENTATDASNASSAQSAEAPGGQDSQAQVKPMGPLGQFLFFAVFLFVFVWFAGWALAGCSSPPKQVIKPHAYDAAGILGAAAISQIEHLAFPPDVPVLVRTLGTIEPLTIGSIASDMMEEEDYWKTVRPRGFLRNIFRQDKDWSTGVYVLVSTNPALVQIRYGPDLRMAAYQQGIACGPWYRQKQSFSPAHLDSHLLQIMTDLRDAVNRMHKPSWLLRKLQSLASLVWSEMEEWIMPSDNFFTDTALKNYLKVMSILGGTGSVWRFTLVSLALYVVVWLLGKKILLDAILLPRIQKKAAKVGIEVTAAGGLVAFLLTGFAALLVLAHGRVEDELALQNLGLSNLSFFALSPEAFTVRGGWWFAIPGVFVAFLKDVVEMMVARQEKPSEINFSLAWVAWFAALFLMPKAICTLALILLVIQLFTALSEFIRGDTSNAT